MMDNHKSVNYANITINDKNPIKRFLQNKRLNHALLILENIALNSQPKILDYGSGDGELCIRISEINSGCRIICYEPAESLRIQAQEKLSHLNDVGIISNTEHLESSSFDLIFCLEVFEHLPGEIIEKEFVEFKRLLKPDGKLVIGIPNETYFAALFKGALRFKRRKNDIDGSLMNILRSSFGFPPLTRPIIELDGLPYISRHMGFDYRVFRNHLALHFNIEKKYGSPNKFLPTLFNLEVYFICSQLN